MTKTEVFSLTDTPLRTSMLIEASAGTGKTYSLNHIVLRLLVEESIPINRILLVTFTKSATAEMAARIRSLLLEVTEALREQRDEGGDFATEPSALFAALDENLRVQYAKWRAAGIAEDDILARLEAAADSMDDAAIYTIHSFCQRMLTDFVFASQGAFETEVTDDHDLILKAVDSVIRTEAAKMSNCEECAKLLDKEMAGRYIEFLEKLSNMSKITPFAERVKSVTGKPWEMPEPEAEDSAAEAAEPEGFYGFGKAMESFIAEAPKELERLKTEKGVMTFANMLVDMEYQVVKNEEFRKAIAARYDAVLIDEFQDTDPIQFNIFRTLFLAPKTPEGEAPEEQKPLIFVGDPKQSIYAFRSADLDTYLDARDEVAKVCVLEKNFRSHPGIVESINTVFSLSKPESSFLNPRIGFEPVKYSNRGGLYELGKDEEGNPVKKPLPPFTLWKYEEAVDPSLFNADGEFQKPSAQDLYSQEARLVAEDIVRLTSGSVYMEGKHGDRPVHPSDVCVLVRKRSDAENLKKELRKRKIRYIIKIDESVLASPEAREIEVILEAIENPKNRSAMANARATNIFGETLRDIEENTEAGLTARLQIEEAGRDIETRGVLAAFKKLFVRRRVEERLLRTDSGERMLTNYDHVLELLYKASRRVKTASGILRWLQDAVADGKDGDDYKLRLESDADLVRIETIHTSKGLEFPIVYTLRNTYFKASKPYPKNVFDGEAKGKKVTWLNIGGGWDEKSYPPYKAAQLQENCRLLYVALTRAGCYLGVPYLMPVNKPKKKGVMDFGKGGAETTLGRVLTGAETPTAAGVLKALHELKAQVTPLGCLVKDVTPEYKKDHDKPSVSDADLHWKKDADDTLSAAPAAHVASDWGRTSFTGMTQAIEEDKEQPALDENDDFPEETDEAEVPKSAAPSSPDPDPFRYKDRATPATAYGDFVHKLLEAVRFDDPDPAEIRKTVASVFDRMDIKSAAPAGEEGATDEELRARHIEALSVMVENVLCAQALAPLPEFRLKMLSEKEKASEMDFLLSNNMTEEGTTLTARELSNALEALDPEKYGGLHLNEKQPLTGYLSGSIDLAFAADGKFWIIDWKTNFLSENAADYSGQVLEEAMQKKHYKLQYLLYLAALKRHLKLRFGFENPYEHIGGAAYFFLRGVKAGSGRGIYFDRPDAAVIGCIDELLAKGWNEDTVKKYKELMKNSKEGA